MIYNNVISGKFIDRPNRFIANVEVEGISRVCHVKNTGRCKEILLPGTDVFLQHLPSPSRKTSYDLISAYKGNKIINIDSQAPNKIFMEFLQQGKLIPDITHIKPECRHLNSRFDFYVESGDRKMFIEVKGVTLEKNGVMKFPDAPTERGVRHVNELCECIREGFEAYVIFVIQMKGAKYFTPNMDTHPKFGLVLEEAKQQGVKVLAFECEAGDDYIFITDEVPVIPGIA
ncbi:sugar fermentation stimulation protein A [Parasporobacterium paucivorans DSM 15970]|uniref:Sugar fermentation stimulation protein homolog n=2 Tax=Parasporobacterium TaxID=115543 RepID=A0A1M6GY53_9FIRM|nr:sugar fermentation stimulation protein A [Parasporobacterium paucivorans DSM 15970]